MTTAREILNGYPVPSRSVQEVSSQCRLSQPLEAQQRDGRPPHSAGMSHTPRTSSPYTLQVYAKLRDRKTPCGFTLDEAIQTGVDNPGHPFIKTVGMVAGDEESYEVRLRPRARSELSSQVFADLFDPVIDERHGGYPKNAVHPTDLDPSKVRAQLNSRYRTIGRSSETPGSTKNTCCPVASGRDAASGDSPCPRPAPGPRGEKWKRYDECTESPRRIIRTGGDIRSGRSGRQPLGKVLSSGQDDGEGAGAAHRGEPRPSPAASRLPPH